MEFWRNSTGTCQQLASTVSRLTPSDPFWHSTCAIPPRTKELDETGFMAHEGEAKVTVRFANLTRSSGSILLAGHSSNGWVPGPFPMAHSGWAASTTATLSQLIPQASAKSGSIFFWLPYRRQRRSSNARCRWDCWSRPVVRRITLPGDPQDIPMEMVQSALLRDPISIAYKQGGILLEHNVVVG
ncbi:MAG: hypothetical protein CM1200mP27_11410 [Chloroflexota bacterium]|nr:MAG: hypothetical protein CM1200mP27_11410 [Chloroflexota bacterium]